MAEPNFFVIGAQKSGTTWFQEIVGQHPDVFLPEVKEVNFFVKPEHNRHSRFEKGWNWYQSLYAPHAGKMTGDVTPDYIYWDYCAGDIAEKLPHAKIIAILRHPVDRAYSQYWMTRRNMTHEESFEAILTKNPHLVGRSRYAKQLRTYFEVFPRENIQILFYEELFGNPTTNIKAIFEFLGLSPTISLSRANQRIGSTVYYRGSIGKIVYKYLSPVISHPVLLPMYRAIRHHTNLHGLFVRLFARQQGYPPMQTQTRQQLLDLFAPENDKLEALIGRPVPTAWSR